MPFCRECKFSRYDPDGPYCAHPEVLKTNPYGSIFDVVRGASYIRNNPTDDRNTKPHFSICGPEAVLFEKREACPGRGDNHEIYLKDGEVVCRNCGKEGSELR